MTTRALLTLAAGLTVCPAAFSQTYSLAALETSPGAVSFGFGINEAGDVCGQARFGTANRASLWRPGMAVQAVTTQSGFGADLNNVGQILGSYYSGTALVPFICENNVATPLPLVSGFTFCDSWQLNDSGVCTGSAHSAGIPRALGAACTWAKTGGQWTLSVLPALSNPATGGGAFGISEAGTIVGTSRDPSGTFHACKWEGGIISELVAPTPNSFSAATSMNGAGHYIGYHDHGSPVTSSAFYFDGTSASALAAVPGYTHSYAFRISDSGTIIGWSYNGDSEYPYLTVLDCAATVWRHGIASNVNELIHSTPAPGYHIRQLWDINNRGQIAAYACLNGTGANCAGGTWRSVLLTPCLANCDNSTSAPALNVLDFACFLNRFAEGDAYANCDGSTAPPLLNVLDFSCFLNAFAAGCT